jgi:Thioester domain
MAKEHIMGEPPGLPPTTPRRRRPLHHLKYLGLVIVFLSGPVMFSLAAAGAFTATTKDVDACQDAAQKTPWDWAATKSWAIFDESAAGDGWHNVIENRNATELTALTVDQQKLRLHSASWPIQPKADAKLFFYSAEEVATLVEQARREADRDGKLRGELRRDLYRAQWIAKNSVRDDWTLPDRADSLKKLPNKNDEAAARQLAIWRVVDGLDPNSYSAVPDDISRRAQDLVELATHYTPVGGEPERDLGTASVAAWSARGWSVADQRVRRPLRRNIPTEPAVDL